MLEILPIAFARVNTSKNVLNEIHQIMHSLYQSKELFKKYKTIQWIQRSDEFKK